MELNTVNDEVNDMNNSLEGDDSMAELQMERKFNLFVGKAQTCSFAEVDKDEFVQVINCFDDHWDLCFNR